MRQQPCSSRAAAMQQPCSCCWGWAPSPCPALQAEALLQPPLLQNGSSPASAPHSASLPCSPPTAIKGDSPCCGGCVPKLSEEKYVGACLAFSALSAPNASDARIKHFPHWERGLCSQARSPSTLQCNVPWTTWGIRVEVCKHQVLGQSLCT